MVWSKLCFLKIIIFYLLAFLFILFHFFVFDVFRYARASVRTGSYAPASVKLEQ